jgi:hypothetical protein
MSWLANAAERWHAVAQLGRSAKGPSGQQHTQMIWHRSTGIAVLARSSLVWLLFETPHCTQMESRGGPTSSCSLQPQRVCHPQQLPACLPAWLLLLLLFPPPSPPPQPW